MIFRTKDGQQKHDAAVAYYAAEFAKKNYVVYADLPDKAKPPEINGFVPDIYAIFGNKLVVVEIETVDSVNTEHARQQDIAFYQWKQVVPLLREYYKKVV